MEECDQPSSPSSPSLKQRLRSSLCLPYYPKKHIQQQSQHQHQHQPHHQQSHAVVPTTPSSNTSPRLSRTSSLKIPELKDRCKTLISRIGRHNSGRGHGHGHGHARRHSMSSADFHYDALSYSLNFDDGGCADGDHSGEYAQRSFSARLPPSPTREIKCN